MAYFTSMALKATQGYAIHNYLGVITDDTENQNHLAYSTLKLLAPNAKFAVEYSRDGLVHIRSCATNKYWSRSSAEGYWIMANASEPVEDESAWNCTLFRADITGSDNNYQAKFYHVQSKTTVGIPNDDSLRKVFLCIDPSATEAISIAIDLDTIPILPKYVAFQADNGLFFDYSTLGFTTSDNGIESVMNETEITKDGELRIKQKGDTGLYWCINSDEMLPIPPLPAMKDKLLFAVVKLKGNNTIALRHLATDKYCRRGDGKGNDEKVYAVASSIVKEAQFQVVECAFSRTVQVLEFDLDKSRIYNLSPISSDTHTYDNPTDEEQEATMNLSISTTKTSTWNNSVSIGLGVETTFKTGVPFIAEGSITVSAETSYSHDFGGTVEEAQEVGDTYTVKVPPMTRVTGRGEATKGTCDVPFSYSQVDHLPDGSIERTTLSDGVYTGVNAYNFYHDVHYEDVPEELKLKFATAKSTA
ncbi:hypothetical protein RND81_03G108900 [Saponaria officinalis]|uniref:Agglutinin domain-containing protein n=1 Tax=Saponaria officinalis TaxID=3572 RepID=A0AAW1M6N8_SAPOF